MSQIELETLSDAAYKMSDDKHTIKKLTESGYTVAKTAEFSKDQLEELAKGMNLQVVEFEIEEVLTPEQLRAQIKSELEFETKLETEITGMKKIIPPALQHVVEFAIREAAKKREEIVEFSETEKVSEFEKITGEIKSLGRNKVFETYFQDVTEFEEKNEVASDKDRIDTYFK